MRGPDRLIRASVLSRFVVTMHSGDSFEGLLRSADELTLVLVDAAALTATGRTLVDGQLFLPRVEVAYLQRPEPGR